MLGGMQDWTLRVTHLIDHRAGARHARTCHALGRWQRNARHLGERSGMTRCA